MDTIISILKNEPELIPMYLFMAFLIGLIGWEFIKLIIYAIRMSGKDTKKTKK